MRSKRERTRRRKVIKQEEGSKEETEWKIAPDETEGGVKELEHSEEKTRTERR